MLHYVIQQFLHYAVNNYLSVVVSYEYAVTTRDSLQYEDHLVEAKIAFAY